MLFRFKLKPCLNVIHGNGPSNKMYRQLQLRKTKVSGNAALAVNNSKNVLLIVHF